jgi:FkbM family methyltransferase
MAYNLSYFNVAINKISGIERDGDFVVFKKTSNKIFIDHLAIFQFSINDAIELLQNNKFTVVSISTSGFQLSVNGLLFNVHSLSNMAVLYEVFIEQIYSVSLLPKDLVVMDIGMNVGVASQYFANMNQVIAVYGYEPFLETYQEALENIKLNSVLAKKIICNNFGVSNISEQREISFFDSGLLSASTIINSANNYGKDATKNITVTLKSITEVFDTVINDYPSNPILLKIDCEGEEYVIFEMLSKTSYLNKVSCALIEWHENGADSIITVLKENNFQLLLLPHASENCGMIYAFKN